MPSSVNLEEARVPGEPGIPLLLFYPTAGPEKPQRLGAFTLNVARGMPPLPGPHPLVLVSHGTGGRPATHRELARHLASLGFVVAVPEHPRDNRNDASGAGSIELLTQRPDHLRRVADWVLAQPRLGVAKELCGTLPSEDDANAESPKILR